MVMLYVCYRCGEIQLKKEKKYTTTQNKHKKLKPGLVASYTPSGLETEMAYSYFDAS